MGSESWRQIEPQLRPEEVPTVPLSAGTQSNPPLADPSLRASSQLKPGMTLDNRYLIEEELGRGGFGAVFRARDQKLHNAPVVVKALHIPMEQGQAQSWVERKFRQEIEALSRLDHPHIVRALDLGHLPDGRIYLVMQYVPGVSLRSALDPYGMPLERAARLLQQIAQGIGAAHEQGVIHRDLKPANIMLQNVGGEEYVKLIDFGIATVREQLSASATETTQTVGTLAYMAPEQLRGKPTFASDIYALGVLAYELVTGRRPFSPDSGAQLLEMQQQGVPVLPCALRPDLPVAAQAVILKALSFQAKDRYQSAREFSAALQQALMSAVPTPPSLSTTPAPTLTVAPPTARTTPRYLWQLLAALLFIVFSGAAVLWLIKGRTVTPPLVGTPRAERQLSYTMEVLKDAGSRPFLVSRSIVFTAGNQVRLLLDSPQSGYLYVINESPTQGRDAAEFNLLFPYSLCNNGAASVSAQQRIQIPCPSAQPAQDWFFFDHEEGVEKVWLIWAAQPVPEMEAIKHYATPQARGVISAPQHKQTVAQFLAAHADAQPETNDDEIKKQVQLKTPGELLIGLVKLEHR